MSEERTEQDELDTKIMRSSAWAFLGYGGTNILSLVTTIVLARLLVPEDSARCAHDLPPRRCASCPGVGLGAALIVYKGDLHRAAASVSVFSPIVALGMYTAVFALAPLLADIFHSPPLTGVLRATALVIPLRGLAIMPQALLERAMLFAPIAGMELAAGLAQAGVAIGLAVAGAGVWSLVAGQIAGAFAQLFLAWWWTPLRPSLRDASWETLRELARFGRHVGTANILNYGNKTADGIILGRVLGTVSLGYYSVANRLASMPVQVFGNILGRGVYAAMAHISDDLQGCKRIWLENVQRLAFVSVPATIGIIFVADPLVNVMLGSKWDAAIVPLQILALNGITRTFSATSGEVFQALERPHYRIYAEFAHLMLVIPALVVGALWKGVNGVAVAIVLVNIAIGIPVLIVVMRLLNAHLGEIAQSMARPAVGWVLMTVTLLALTPFAATLSPLLALLVLVLAGGLVYVGSVMLFARDLLDSMWLSLRGTRTSS